MSHADPPRTEPDDDSETRLLDILYPLADQQRDDELGEAHVSELEGTDVKPKKRVRDYRDEIDDEEVERHRQANRLREALFWFGLVLASITVATSAFVAVWGTIAASRLATPAMVAFISGLSIQTIGILWIMARYLFSPPHKTRPEPRDEA